MQSLPFTTEQFLDVFRQYNESVFPAQVLLFLAGVVIAFLIFQKRASASRWVSFLLAVLWIWTGSTYHILFFTNINKGAYLFGALFILQGLLFVWAGYKEYLFFQKSSRPLAIAGWSFIAYAMVIYPVLGRLFGHQYLEIPTFGLPCPLVIFTFGVLLLTGRPFSRWLLVIPTLWALIGASAVVFLGIYQDAVLLISALVAWPLLIRRERKETNLQ